MYTPEIITSLKPNEIFVFGSNNLGQHAGGAAVILAMQCYMPLWLSLVLNFKLLTKNK